MMEALHQNADEQRQHDLHVDTMDLSLIQKGNKFCKLKTHIPSLFILLIIVSQCVVTALVETEIIVLKNITITPIQSRYFLSFHLLLVLQSVAWAVIAAIDRVIHNMSGAHKKSGYVSFYSNTKFVRRLPSYISSTGCAVCLLVAGFWGDRHEPWHKVTPCLVILGIVALQGAAMIPAVIYYIGTVLKFNKDRPLPDMQRYLPRQSHIQVQIGNKRTVEDLEITIDKQSDIIQSLQTHNQVLGRRIMSLHKQIKV